MAIPSSAEAPLSAAQVLESCGDAFLHGGQEVYATLREAALPVADRLRAVVQGLNRGRFVLVLDNFESNLDEATRRILAPELARFYRHLLEHLVGGSRLLMISRYLPAEVPRLPGTAVEEQLGEFGEAAFLKFLLRDATVERRHRAGELAHELLVRLPRVLGATPRFLGQIREVLAGMAAEELAAELDRVTLPSAAEEQASPGRLQAARDAYCEAIFTGRLYGRLPPSAQRMLSRATVYGLPVTLEGLAAVAGVEVAAVRAAAAQWRDAALVHVDGSGGGGGELWSVCGMLRSWLLAPERLAAAERQQAQLAAGDFLVALDRQDREGELCVSWVACLLDARAQYLAADALDQARAVTGRLSGFYVRRGRYEELARLNEELLRREEHPGTLTWLGSGACGAGAVRAGAAGLRACPRAGRRGRSRGGQRRPAPGHGRRQRGRPPGGAGEAAARLDHAAADRRPLRRGRGLVPARPAGGAVGQARSGPAPGRALLPDRPRDRPRRRRERWACRGPARGPAELHARAARGGTAGGGRELCWRPRRCLAHGGLCVTHRERVMRPLPTVR